MNALATRKLSPLARRERLASARALAAPMTRIPMAGDPYMPRVDNRDAADAFTMRDGRAMLERRACQYAAFIGARDGKLTQPMRQYNAVFDGAKVHFDAYDSAGLLRTTTIEIPAHVLAFDANAPALALPAPDAEPGPAPRCDNTAPLALDPPAPIAAPRAAQAEPDELCALDDDGAPPADYRRPIEHIAAPNSKAAQRPRKRPAKAMREWAESRAMRATRSAMLPESTRRAIGQRI